MNVICSGLRGRNSDSRSGITKLSVIVLAGDLGFAHGVDGGVDHDDAQNRILVIGSVQNISGRPKVLAIDLNLNAALRIF